MVTNAEADPVGVHVLFSMNIFFFILLIKYIVGVFFVRYFGMSFPDFWQRNKKVFKNMHFGTAMKSHNNN